MLRTLCSRSVRRSSAVLDLNMSTFDRLQYFVGPANAARYRRTPVCEHLRRCGAGKSPVICCSSTTASATIEQLLSALQTASSTSLTSKTEPASLGGSQRVEVWVKDPSIVQVPSRRRRKKGGPIKQPPAPFHQAQQRASRQHLYMQPIPHGVHQSKVQDRMSVDLLGAISASEAATPQHRSESQSSSQEHAASVWLPPEGQASAMLCAETQLQHSRAITGAGPCYRAKRSDLPAALRMRDPRAQEAHAIVQWVLEAELHSLESAPVVASDREGGEADEGLDMAFNQLPRWWNKRTLDWSGSTDYIVDHKQACSPQWSPSLATEKLDLVDVEVEGELVSVLPMWIAVHQESSKPARLYESILPLDDDIIANLAQPLDEFCAAEDLTFSECDDMRGAWHNYCIGIVGNVANEEHEVLWPNQVLHGDRTMYNVRSGTDLARFLANPVKEDMEAHLHNLRVLQEERGYREGWCYVMLRSRWGRQALKKHGMILKPST